MGNSIYHSFQLKAEQRATSGLSVFSGWDDSGVLVRRHVVPEKSTCPPETV